MIEEWSTRSPFANIGIATGTKSGIVRDRSRNLPRALESLEKLVHKLPSTLTGLTGGGGLHLIYRGNCEDLRCTTAQVPGIGPLPGVDLRPNGGYIVNAPYPRPRAGQERSFGFHSRLLLRLEPDVAQFVQGILQ